MKKILVAEDEQNIREFVVINLKRAGYDCVEAASGEEALRVYEQAGGDFDVAVLDIMMPGSLDGLAVCKELRQKNATIGIIMLTAKTQEMDKVTGLMMGADDYVTKPFSPSELVARVDAVYRRVAQFTRAAEPNFSEELRSGRFVLNLRNRSFTKDGNPVELTAREFDLLELLMKNPNRVYSREQLLNLVWGYEYTGEYRTVDVHIRRLREKVEQDPAHPAHLCTKWGVGYYFKEA